MAKHGAGSSGYRTPNTAVTRDGMGSMRLLFPTLELLETSLAADLAERGRFSRNAQPTQGLKQLVVVLDDGFVTGDERLVTDAGMDGVTLLDLNGPRDGADGAARPAVGCRRRRRGSAHRGGDRALRHPRHASPSQRPRPRRDASAGSGPPTRPTSSAWNPTRAPWIRG